LTTSQPEAYRPKKRPPSGRGIERTGETNGVNTVDEVDRISKETIERNFEAAWELACASHHFMDGYEADESIMNQEKLVARAWYMFGYNACESGVGVQMRIMKSTLELKEPTE
jgi:hypothetical protein